MAESDWNSSFEELGQMQAIQLKHLTPIYEIYVKDERVPEVPLLWMALGKFKSDDSISRQDQVNQALRGESFTMNRLSKDAMSHLGRLPVTHAVDGLMGIDLKQTVQKHPKLVKYLHHKINPAD